MFPRLRHDPFVRRDHQKHQVHAHHARNHIINEAFMPRNVDNPDTVAARKIKIREPQVYRNPSPLFFLPAVRIPSRQRLDQRRLAVIDMSRSTNNDILHICLPPLHFYSFTVPQSD